MSPPLLGGQSQGAEVAPRHCRHLGALLWSICFAHPGTGLTPIWDQAVWLLLSFSPAFDEKWEFLLRLLPRKRWASHSFAGPSQGFPLTLMAGPGFSFPIRTWGGEPLSSADR